ncbi:unnamed protein product [Psylliodes chrysocephalus]|uniref:Uncharacterized protein n=1 Tax=Psylliodes chrysocephalus TaxID=3402493 RepID=A0A9P0DC06_9CUCU|nr:unnamed protein product [Psylliodes chrysocephala]
MGRFLIKTQEKPTETITENKLMEVDTQPSTSFTTQKDEKNEITQNTIILSESDNSSRSSDEKTIKKNKYIQKFKDSWLEDIKFNTWLVRNPRQQDQPFCKLCSKGKIMGNYTKKSKRSQSPKEVIENAVNRVLHNNESVRSVTRDAICHVTLSRYVRRFRQNNNNGKDTS